MRKGITLEINQNAHLDVDLNVGTESQVIEVVGNVTQVDTVSATLGKVETSQRIETLPLAARDTMQFGPPRPVFSRPTRMTARATHSP